MTITIDGKEYKSKMAFFREMNEIQRDGETYQSFHRRCNIKYFPEIRKNYQDMCGTYKLRRYHEDPEYRQKDIQRSLQYYYTRVKIKN